jgi:hypothetical protein
LDSEIIMPNLNHNNRPPSWHSRGISQEDQRRLHNEILPGIAKQTADIEKMRGGINHPDFVDFGKREDYVPMLGGKEYQADMEGQWQRWEKENGMTRHQLRREQWLKSPTGAKYAETMGGVDKLRMADNYITQARDNPKIQAALDAAGQFKRMQHQGGF